MSAVDGPFYIYIITNKVTHKSYVGVSSNIKKRFENHRRALKRHDHPMEMMQDDYNKYGADSFVYKVFTKCSRKWESRRIETIVMKILKTQNPKYGYNYKDRKGNAPLAIADRWRTDPRNWSDNRRLWHYDKYGVLLPPYYT